MEVHPSNHGCKQTDIECNKWLVANCTRNDKEVCRVLAISVGLVSVALQAVTSSQRNETCMVVLEATIQVTVQHHYAAGKSSSAASWEFAVPSTRIHFKQVLF